MAAAREPTRRETRPRRWIFLGGLLLAAAALRLAIVSMPPEDLSPEGRVPAEEFRRGVVAMDLAQGPVLPLSDYQLAHFWGGSGAYVALAAASYTLLGSSPFALRLPAVLFSVAGVALTYVILRRHAGDREARLGGLLAAAASPGLLLVSSAAWGTHAESAILALALVLAYLEVAERRSAPGWLAFGVLAGFSLWFGYSLAVVFAPLLAIQTVREPRWLLDRRAGFGLIGLLVGLAPWFAYNLAQDFAGLGVYGRTLSRHFGHSPLEQALELIRLVPESLWMPATLALPFVLVAYASMAWLLVHAPRFLRSRASSRRERLALATAAVTAAYAIAYAFGNFRLQPGDWVHGYRIAIPLHPFLWIGTALVLARLAPRVATAAAVAWALASLGCTLALLEPARWRASFAEPGHSWESFGRYMLLRRGGDPDVLIGSIERLLDERPDEVADEALFALGAGYRHLLRPKRGGRHDPRIDAARSRVAASVPERYRPYFEPLRPGERNFRWSDRARFWEQYRAREPRPATTPEPARASPQADVPGPRSPRR